MSSKEQPLNFSLSCAIRVWYRSVYIYKRTWLINLLPNFFEPVIYLIGMGIGLGAYIGQQMQGMDYLHFIAPGLVIANAMNGATFETTYNLFVKIHFDKKYDAIIATPVNIEDAMLGELLWATTRGMIYGGVFAIVIFFFGLINFQQILLLLPVIFLTSFLFGAIGLVFTAYIELIDLYSFYYTLFLTPMYFFSGIFFPVENIEWVNLLAQFTPLYHAVKIAKAVAFDQFEMYTFFHLSYLIFAGLLLSYLGIKRIKSHFMR